MITLVIALRVLHIVAGILWAGGAVLYFMFIEPAAEATSPESRKFMGYLMTQKQFSKFMSLMSLLTILAGAALYYRLRSVDWQWVATGPGIGFTIGALAGILAYANGSLFIGPRAVKLGQLSEELQASQGAASEAKAMELNRVRKEMDLSGRLGFALIAIALLTMSTARYWSF